MTSIINTKQTGNVINTMVHEAGHQLGIFKENTTLFSTNPMSYVLPLPGMDFRNYGTFNYQQSRTIVSAADSGKLNDLGKFDKKLRQFFPERRNRFHEMRERMFLMNGGM